MSQENKMIESQNSSKDFQKIADKLIMRDKKMYQIKILDINNNILDKIFLMSQPSETIKQKYWIESLYKFGGLIVFQCDKVKYVEI